MKSADSQRVLMLSIVLWMGPLLILKTENSFENQSNAMISQHDTEEVENKLKFSLNNCLWSLLYCNMVS